MFANTDFDDSSDETQEQDRKEHFDERSEIHERYWVACDCNRRNGPQILNSDTLTVKGTDSGVSGVVDDYHFFENEKKSLITEITEEKDMFGLRKYRNDFSEPDPDMWAEHASEHYGIDIVDCHKIPSDVASERFDVDYSKENVDPVFVPVIETDDGEEVIYDPVNFYDDNDTDDSDETSEDDLPFDNAEDAQEYLEEIEQPELNKQEAGCLAKLRHPDKSNKTLAEAIGCSKNSVRLGCIKFLGDDGYKQLKQRGKEIGNDAEDYEKQMETSTDGGNKIDTDGDQSRIDELEQRIEKLEALFNSDMI